MKVIIQNNQIGLLFNKQKLKKILEVGEYHFFKNVYVVIVNKKKSLESFNLELKAIDNKILQSMVETIQVKDHEIAFHFVDLLFYEILPSGTYSFINDIYKHTFTICDTRNIELPESIHPGIFQSRNYIETFSKQRYISEYLIQDNTVGALFVNGKFTKLLQPNKYYFLVTLNDVKIKPIDLRIKTVQISGQELLTKDKVTLRLNFVLTYNIIDSLKVATKFENFDEQLYITIQLALREYVSTRNLDELLAEKHEIGNIILQSLKEKQDYFGTSFLEAGVKDIILPGDIKEILNTVLIAEKKALANVITRREETSSTRSLLNTAKLMEENEILYKLKELEYLERICDKVGNISLSSSGGILEQLSEIIKTKK